MRTLSGNPFFLDRKSVMEQRVYKILNRIPHLPSPRRYNLTICNERQFIWFRVAKVGTRTIFNYLKDSELELDVEHVNAVHYPAKQFAHYFKFAFVRNPWDRVVSCWRNKVIDSNTLFKLDDATRTHLQEFENFVEFVGEMDIETCDRHLRAQTSLIDLNNVDFVGRLERFDSDFEVVCQQIGLQPREVVARNVSSRERDYRNYYTEELADRVARIYRKDIQLLGYEF